jgi:hypothetical protein
MRRIKPKPVFIPAAKVQALQARRKGVAIRIPAPTPPPTHHARLPDPVAELAKAWVFRNLLNLTMAGRISWGFATCHR